MVPKWELGKVKHLVDKFEAQLQVQCRQRVRERQGRLPLVKTGKYNEGHLILAETHKNVTFLRAAPSFLLNEPSIMPPQYTPLRDVDGN